MEGLMRHFPRKQYTAAAKSSTLDPTATAVSKLGNLLAKDPKLVKILEAPTLSAADKNSIIAELEKVTGANDTVKHFLSTLAEYNRLSLLNPIVSKFHELVAAAHGELEVIVKSATVRVPELEGVGIYEGRQMRAREGDDRTATLPDGRHYADRTAHTASGQQDPEQARGCCLQVPLRRPEQEAQGHQRGTILPSATSPRPCLRGLLTGLGQP